MFIYSTDRAGILTGPVELPTIPGLGVQLPSSAIQLAEPLPAPAPGHVWTLVNGQPQQLADRRGIYYRTDTGERIEHDELGELPEGLTAEPWPGPCHTWQAGGWAPDEAAQLAAVQADERAWRDTQIASVEWMRDRHRDQVEVGVQTTLTAAQYIELLQYIQSLRDWPQSAAFPTPADRPQPPEWLTDQLADAA